MRNDALTCSFLIPAMKKTPEISLVFQRLLLSSS